MKIDAQSMLFTRQRTSENSDQASGFETLLTTQPRQADDYYWQHQNQLQQSAISFKPVKMDANPQIKPKLVEETCVSQQQIYPVQLDVADHVELQKSEPQLSADQPHPATKIVIEQLITRIKKSIEQLKIQSEHAIAEQPNIPNIANLTPMPLTAVPITFKNYQLFLNDNQVELTFNTSGLSKQQINELHNVVKQWLVQKGYALKQLTINGVQQ